METKEFVLQWLKVHQGFQQEDVSKEDMAHFVGILSDICDAMKQKTIDDSVEWLEHHSLLNRVGIEEFQKSIK